MFIIYLIPLMTYQITLDLYELFIVVTLLSAFAYCFYRVYKFSKKTYFSLMAEYTRLMMEYEEIKRTIITASETINRYDQRLNSLRSQTAFSTLYQTYVTPFVTYFLNRYLTFLNRYLTPQTNQYQRQDGNDIQQQQFATAIMSELERMRNAGAQHMPATQATINPNPPTELYPQQNINTDFVPPVELPAPGNNTEYENDSDSDYSSDSETERLIPMRVAT